MGNKRRHEDDEGPAKTARHGGSPSQLKAYIIALNKQFAKWVGEQQESCLDELWTDGVRDYLEHVDYIAETFKDLLGNGKGESQAAPQQPASVGFFGSTPKGTAADKADGPSPITFGQTVTPEKASPSPLPSAGLFGSKPSTTPASGGDAAKPASSTPGSASGAAAAPTSTPAAIFGFGSSATAAPASSSPSLSFLSASSKDQDKDGSATAAAASKDASKSLFAFGSTPASTTSKGQEKGGKDSAEDKEGTDAPSTGAFGFGKPPASSTEGLFTFGAAAGTASSTAAPFSFGSAATSAPAASSTAAPAAFSFGAAAASSAASTTSTTAPFSFGGAPAASGTSGPFSFGNAATTAPPAAGGDAAAAGGEGDEDEGPKKYESELAVDDKSGTVLFKCKSKFFHMKKDAEGKGSWDGRGVGQLVLRQANDSSKRPFISFTTDAGKVLYCASLTKTMAVVLNDSKSSASFALPWAPNPDENPTPSMQQVMFQLPKGKHQDFKAEVVKQQEAMP